MKLSLYRQRTPISQFNLSTCTDMCKDTQKRACAHARTHTRTHTHTHTQSKKCNEWRYRNMGIAQKYILLLSISKKFQNKLQHVHIFKLCMRKMSNIITSNVIFTSMLHHITSIPPISYSLHFSSFTQVYAVVMSP